MIWQLDSAIASNIAHLKVTTIPETHLHTNKLTGILFDYIAYKVRGSHYTSVMCNVDELASLLPPEVFQNLMLEYGITYSVPVQTIQHTPVEDAQHAQVRHTREQWRREMAAV